MLTEEGCRARRQRLWESLPTGSGRPELLLVADPQHLMYFANYWHSPFVFRSNDAGAVLILEQLGGAVKATLCGDSMCAAFAERAAVDERVTPVWYDGKHSAPHREGLLVQTVLAELAKRKAGRVGLEMASVPAGIAEGLRSAGTTCVDIDPLIRGLKRRKAPDEVALLKLTMAAAEAGHAAAMKELRPGMTELDAFLLVQSAANRAAGEQCVVYGDFVSGPRCEDGGGPPSRRVLAEGDLFILDFSVVMYQYRCDFANSFVIGGGRATAQQRDLFAACQASMAAAEATVKAGTPCRDIDAAGRSVFAARHLTPYRHHTGHGIGVGHPEPPYIVPDSSESLLAGDVITIEPGQYVKGVGGMRFERNYLVTDAGYELLSRQRVALEL